MNAAMTVILFTPTDYTVVRRTMRHLRAQTVPGELEVLITAPVAANVRLEPAEVTGFADVRVIEVGPVETLAAAHTVAIRQARAPVVVLGEDHSFPEPGWAAALIAAHGQGYAAVGPAMINANPGTLTSWANYIPYFSSWRPGQPAEDRDYLASHNSSYKRDLLLACGGQLEFFLGVESILQQHLRAQGHRLRFESAAQTRHVNFSRWIPLIGQCVCGGRLYGGSRASWEQWPWWRRVIYVGGSPLIPLLRLRRMWPQARERFAVWPPLVWGALWHAVGEALGYGGGVGNAEKRYLDYETMRTRFVIAAEQRELAE